MAMDVPASAPSRLLPSLGGYLSTLFDLGRRSIPFALPALVFLWLYHFGTALYLELAGRGTSPLGYRDTDALLIETLLKVSTYLPLLVLVYTPFLPLQDAILRGERPSFLAAIRQVLEVMVPFVLSVILQLAIVLTPVVIVVGVLIAAITPIPDLPREVVALIVVATVIPLLIWLCLSGFVLVFAVPGVVLSGLGPTRSVAASVRLAGSHFGGLLLRFFVFFVILFVVVMVASIPAGILGAAAAAVSRAEPLFRMGSILWTSLITALTFPFWVASCLVLYRALVPGPSTADAAAREHEGAALPEGVRREGDQVHPFQFE